MLFLGEFMFEVEDRSPTRREAESYEKVGIIIVVYRTIRYTIVLSLIGRAMRPAESRFKKVSRVVTSSKREACIGGWS